jgi:hypothetical protein
MKRSAPDLHQYAVQMPKAATSEIPDVDTIRHDSLKGGGSDPLSLRFRLVEYERGTGDFIRVLLENSGFPEAVENATRLIAGNDGSHFCLEPVGFVQ